MEESTSWKNHSFTLLIFGGIVIVCSIFFALGMLVGRSQGQRIAEIAFAEEAASKPAAEDAGDDFKLNYYSETTSEKPADLTLQPPEPQPAPRPDPPAVAAEPPATKPAATVSPAAKPAGQISTATKTATPKVTTSKPPAAPVVGQVYLQVFATRNQKQANAEQKRVQSKGFKAKVVTDAQMHRVYVGPYAKSAVNLAKSDLKAKGFGDVVVRQ